MSNSPRLVSSVVVSSVGNLMPPLVGLITAPLLAQALGVSGRGETAAATAPVVLAATALSIGLPEAVTYFVARSSSSTRHIMLKAVALAAGAGVFGCLLLVVLAPALSAGSAQLTDLIRLCGFGLMPTLLLSVVRGFAAAQQAWSLIAVERFISSAVRLVVIAALFLLDNLSVSIAAQVIVFSALVGSFAYLPLVRMSRVALSGEEHVSSGDILAYGFRVWFGSLAGILLTRVDQTLLLPLAGAAALGLYVVAVSVADVLLVLTSAVRDVMFSRESSNPSLEALSSVARISTALTIVPALFIGLVSWPLLPLLFGRDFGAALPVVWILLLANIAGVSGSVAGVGLAARGTPGRRSISVGIAASVNITILAILAPQIGALGAAFATLLGNWLAGFLNILFMRSLHGSRIGDFYGLRRADVNSLARAVKGHRTRRGSQIS